MAGGAEAPPATDGGGVHSHFRRARGSGLVLRAWRLSLEGPTLKGPQRRVWDAGLGSSAQGFGLA